MVSPCLTSARKVIGPVPAGGAWKTKRSRNDLSSASPCINAWPLQPGSGGSQNFGFSSSAIFHVPTLRSFASTAYSSRPRYFDVSWPTVVAPASRLPTIVRAVIESTIGKSSPGM